MNAQTAPSGTSAKADVDAILMTLAAESSGAKSRDAQTFAVEFLRRLPAEDLASRDAAQWAAIVRGALEFMRERQPGAAKLRVFNPDAGDTARADRSRTVVEIVTDDMPFLVDSVGMRVTQAGLSIHTVIHPMFRVTRDPGGHLLTLAADDGSAGTPESVMHFEIDRVGGAAEIEKLKQGIAATLEDVRESVTDWAAMRKKMIAIADDMGKRRLPVDADGVAEAQEFLRWAANDHFTFLGYREYEVARAGDDDVL